MNRGECAAVSGVHRLEQVIAALIANLAHNDPVRTMPKCSGQKFARRDGNLAGNLLDGLPPDCVGMRYL